MNEQISAVSPLIFVLIDRLFHCNSVSELKLALNKWGFTEDEYTEKFEKLVLSSQFAAKHPQNAHQLLSKCLLQMYSLKDKDCCLGFPYKGSTTYLSKNITEEDLETVKEFLKNKNLEPWNMRSFKTADKNGRTIYEIRLASVLET
ncbi:hypothetical protein AVEN_241014-1, partial [Araneus ventricosus]